MRLLMNKRLSLVVLAVLLLSGCADSGLFSDEDKAPLEGERISVLQLQRELVPDPALENSPVALPEVWANQYWPQVGGYPSHAMGHLALGAKLQEAWQVSIGSGGDRRTPLTTAPVVAESAVFTLDTKGIVSAFDIATGARKWKQSVVPRGEEDSGAVGGGIAWSSGKLFVTGGYKYISALNPDNGALVWKAEIQAPARAAPTVMDDRVYLITLDSRLLVLSAADGSLLWTREGVGETTNLLGSAAPAVDSSLVVMPMSSGEIYGLRPENGQTVWQDNLSAVRRVGAMSSIADIRALPVIDQNVVYAVGYSGRMVAIDPVSGRRYWQRELGSAETPWAAGDVVFVMSTEQQLTALTRQGGAAHWVVQLPRFEDGNKEKPTVWSGPVLAGGRLFTVSSAGEMLEIAAQDGKILRKYKLGHGATRSPVVANGTLLVLTEDGKLMAWR